jgi:CBS domain-containing protein
MKVEEIMTTNPTKCTVKTSLHDVAQLMAEYDCGCLPVTEHTDSMKPVGVITDRDITLRSVAHNKNPLMMIAGEVMTDSIITVTPGMTVEECCTKMENNQIRRVPVVDNDGNLIGMVSQADIVRKLPANEIAELIKKISFGKTPNVASFTAT